MKILYLCHRIPYPPNKGDKIRSYNEVKYLASRHDLDLICLADDPEDLKYKTDLEKICRRVEVFPLNKLKAKIKGLLSMLSGGSISTGYFYKRAMQKVFNRWLADEDYDAIICFSSTMAEYIFRSRCLTVHTGILQQPQLIMDYCDVDSDKWFQYADDAAVPLSFLYRLEQKRLAAYEVRIQQAFDQTVMISGNEAELFRKLCPAAHNLSVVANGVDTDFFQPRLISKEGDSVNLVFTGAMDYHANVDAVVWFGEKIWPVLKKRFANLNFYIVGSKPAKVVRDLAYGDGITVTGFVDDIRDYYAIADVCVVPLRLARGVQNKVLEAMAMGKAVVTTTRANAGILADEGKHLLIADTADDFIDKIESLLKDRGRADQLAMAAREFVMTRYDWKSNMEKLEQLIQRV